MRAVSVARRGIPPAHSIAVLLDVAPDGPARVITAGGLGASIRWIVPRPAALPPCSGLVTAETVDHVLAPPQWPGWSDPWLPARSPGHRPQPAAAAACRRSQRKTSRPGSRDAPPRPGRPETFSFWPVAVGSCRRAPTPGAGGGGGRGDVPGQRGAEASRYRGVTWMCACGTSLRRAAGMNSLGCLRGCGGEAPSAASWAAPARLPAHRGHAAPRPQSMRPSVCRT